MVIQVLNSKLGKVLNSKLGITLRVSVTSTTILSAKRTIHKNT